MKGDFNRQMDIPVIPNEISRLARNNFDSDNFFIRVGSDLEEIVSGMNCILIYKNSQSQLMPLLLPLITFFQHFEKLTDRKALEAIQYRIEWKYALHLPVTPPILHDTILCEYRSYISEDSRRLNEYQRLIDRLISYLPLEKNYFILAAKMFDDICELNQKDTAIKGLYNTLTILKLNHPKWLQKYNIPRLYARYLPTSSQYDMLTPHDITQFQLADVLKDIDFLVREVELSGSVELGNLIEIKALKQIVSQIRLEKTNK